MEMLRSMDCNIIKLNANIYLNKAVNRNELFMFSRVILIRLTILYYGRK